MNKSGTGAKRTVAHHQTIFFQQFKWEEVNSMLCKLQQFYQVQVRVFREWKTEKKIGENQYTDYYVFLKDINM